MRKKTIGIIGGMGPLATADLLKKIVVNTKAESDQEHIRVLMDNNTSIPDRTEAILRGGESPVPRLAESALLLQKMGAELLIMPCNTAHYFHQNVAETVDVPVLNMIEITLDAIREKGIKKAALFATDGTAQSGVYQNVFTESGVELILPDKIGQKAIMDMIYCGIKAGKKSYDVKEVKAAAERLLTSGAEVILLGCTELPLAKEMYNLDYPFIDPTLELAKRAIYLAGGCCV